MQAVIARRDTLLALFDLVADVQADIAAKLLRCVKHLTRDPSMLLPLYVRTTDALECQAVDVSMHPLKYEVAETKQEQWHR